MQRRPFNPYATLGLDRRCSDEQIRAAYRILAKRFHPDLNPASVEAAQQTQELNAAYEILCDPTRRREFDESLAAPRVKQERTPQTASARQNLAQDIPLRLEDFFRGTSLEVRVNDPGNPEGPELYSLTVPPGTAPGCRFRIPRAGAPSAGFVVVRVRFRPDFRFKARGSDLRCDLRIPTRRAVEGGSEALRGPLGNTLRVEIPRGVARGTILRLSGEGLPKLRGGRGDLLLRVIYRPEVRVTRAAGR